MGTCLDAYLDMHRVAAPPHVREGWSTLSKWSLGKCYGVMRALTDAAESRADGVSAGWPEMLAGYDQESERELSDAGTLPVVVASAEALGGVLDAADDGEGAWPTVRTLLGAMWLLERAGITARVLFVRG